MRGLKRPENEKNFKIDEQEGLKKIVDAWSERFWGTHDKCIQYLQTVEAMLERDSRLIDFKPSNGQAAQNQVPPGPDGQGQVPEDQDGQGQERSGTPFSNLDLDAFDNTIDFLLQQPVTKPDFAADVKNIQVRHARVKCPM